jgi:hypothetical protein
MSTIAFGTAPVGRPHLRITRRGRAVLTLLIAIPLAIGAAVTGIGAIGAAAGTQGSTASYQYLTVEPGESVWQVAQSIAPTADPRDVIADILSLNNLSSGDVQPGQRLAIPPRYSTTANGH